MRELPDTKQEISTKEQKMEIIQRRNQQQTLNTQDKFKRNNRKKITESFREQEVHISEELLVRVINKNFLVLMITYTQNKKKIRFIQ